jgi:nucleotide-binding universal stress UspA family protein
MAAAAAVTDARCMHLLCGIDTSDGDPAVAYVAARIAGQMGAELTLAHVVAGGHTETAARALDALAGALAAAFGTRPDVRVVPGDDPAAGLAATARKLECDLIVVGATARGRLAGASRARVRDALAGQADCPVMVVPPGGAAPAGDGVAVAYDASAGSAGAVAVAARLASALDEPLTVIHVLPDPRSYTRSALPMHRDVRGVVDDALDGEELALRHVFAYRLPAPHLVRTVARLEPALVVVAAPASGWRSRLRRSGGARLLRSASCPVVLVPEGSAGSADQRPATRALAAA